MSRKQNAQPGRVKPVFEVIEVYCRMALYQGTAHVLCRSGYRFTAPANHNDHPAIIALKDRER